MRDESVYVRGQAPAAEANREPGMRDESVFEIPCECGQVIESHAPTGNCPHCGREYEVMWAKINDD